MSFVERLEHLMLIINYWYGLVPSRRKKSHGRERSRARELTSLNDRKCCACCTGNSYTIPCMLTQIVFVSVYIAMYL